MSQDCEDHGMKFGGKPHPDKHAGVRAKNLKEKNRGAAHPAKHTAGKMPSQLNPDHGPKGY